MIAASKRVLVVDDEAIVRESYRWALADAGYAVCTAADGREALRVCGAEPFDVLLADLRMPEMDGLELSRAIAREYPELRIVIITGYPSAESAAAAAEIGIRDYLAKPIAPDRLCEAVAAALQRPARAAALGPEQERAEAPIENERPTTMMQPQLAIGPSGAAPQRDLSAFSAGAIILLTPLIGLAYYVLFPFVAAGMFFGVVAEVLAESLGLHARS